MSAVEAKEDTSESEVAYLVWAPSHLGQTHVNFWSSPIKDPVTRHMGYCQEKIAFRFSMGIQEKYQRDRLVNIWILRNQLPVKTSCKAVEVGFLTVCIYDSAREIELNRVTSNSIANSVTQVSQQCDKIRVVGSTVSLKCDKFEWWVQQNFFHISWLTLTSRLGSVSEVRQIRVVGSTEIPSYKLVDFDFPIGKCLWSATKFE
ncbi:hypothetical protein K438DRAFT_1768124 [Mycena galopus ATCC 62051]|nr:hypothetical protein K438DRAFT_1768124 [Mycena galopus ATCC 62051]